MRDKQKIFKAGNPFRNNAADVKYLPLAFSTKSDFLTIVLVAARNPLNIGAAARAMSNFGFSSLRVVNPYEVAFREARSAVGASDVLAKAETFNSVDEAVADCTLVVGTTSVGNRELHHPVRPLADGAKIIRKRMQTNRVALLFGSEKVGLSNDDLSHCHWLMRIPTREEHRSLNVAQAVAICLYELRRDTRMARAKVKFESAKAGEMERVTAMLLDAARASGYLKPRAALPTEEKLRRLVRRLQIDKNDAEVWLGMLRQIVWKLRAGKDRDDQ
ncbi:MAG: TrmJ/YjtD family RNA methyltransferase [Acidobacteria bacterium]|nr:TrmJ/YjtD family RNA methyltransferase [Acidobacteriota bacterium]